MQHSGHCVISAADGTRTGLKLDEGRRGLHPTHRGYFAALRWAAGFPAEELTVHSSCAGGLSVWVVQWPPVAGTVATAPVANKKKSPFVLTVERPCEEAPMV